MRTNGRGWTLALAALGVSLSLLLEYTHYRAYTAPGADSYCSVGEHIDCTRVALSKYGVWLELPVALWGALGFLAIGLASWQRSRWLLPLAAAAAASSLVLLGISAFALGSWCPLCSMAHLVSFSLLFLALRSRTAERVGWRVFDASLLALGPPLGILVALWLFLPRYWHLWDWRAELPFPHGVTSAGDAWIGATQPKLILEEFVDYACPHCQSASSDSLRRLAEHPNELRLVRRYFPLLACIPRAEERCLGLRLAFCAEAQGKFWQADRWLFEQARLAVPPEPADMARDLGLDASALLQCVRGDAAFEHASDAGKRAKKLRILGTPYYASEGKIMARAQALELIDRL
jgi:uncharacterized membrane protein